MRFIATPTLWVQKLTQDGKAHITKIPGASKWADLGTKHLNGESIRRAFEKSHCYVREGRSGIALTAEVQEITRRHPEVFSMMQVNLTRSQKETWDLDSNDSGSSDSGGTETAAGPNGMNPP